MLRVMCANEKCVSYSLEMNQFTDSTKKKIVSKFLGYKRQKVNKLVNA